MRQGFARAALVAPPGTEGGIAKHRCGTPPFHAGDVVNRQIER